MKPSQFNYFNADTIQKALDALSNNENAKIIAGGQSLVQMRNFRLAQPDLLIDMSNINELKQIKEDIESKENLLLIGMNTDVEIEILNEKVAISLPAGSLRTRKDILSVAPLLNIKEDQLRNFLAKKVEGENFDAFIVLKKTKKGAVPTWIKTGKTDLNYVEVKEGIKFDETVYVLPSEGLIKYQQKFSERIKGRFG